LCKYRFAAEYKQINYNKSHLTKLLRDYHEKK